MKLTVIAVLGGGLLAGSALAETATFDAKERAVVQREIVNARAALNRELMDYPSARFRDVQAIRSPSGDAHLLCGYVNAKNKLGAYAGWTRFMWFNGLSLDDKTDTSVVAITCDSGRGVVDSRDYSPDLVSR